MIPAWSIRAWSICASYSRAQSNWGWEVIKEIRYAGSPNKLILGHSSQNLSGTWWYLAGLKQNVQVGISKDSCIMRAARPFDNNVHEVEFIISTHLNIYRKLLFLLIQSVGFKLGALISLCVQPNIMGTKTFYWIYSLSPQRLLPWEVTWYTLSPLLTELLY